MGRRRYKFRGQNAKRYETIFGSAQAVVVEKKCGVGGKTGDSGQRVVAKPKWVASRIGGLAKKECGDSPEKPRRLRGLLGLLGGRSYRVARGVEHWEIAEFGTARNT